MQESRLSGVKGFGDTVTELFTPRTTSHRLRGWGVQLDSRNHEELYLSSAPEVSEGPKLTCFAQLGGRKHEQLHLSSIRKLSGPCPV